MSNEISSRRVSGLLSTLAIVVGFAAFGLAAEDMPLTWSSAASQVPALGSIDAGGYHNCGVKVDGTVACWGYGGVGQSSPPSGTFAQVSGGLSHTCGVKTDGTVVCWGLNGSGQSRPPSGTFTQVSSSDAHTCGLRTDGTVACWGNSYGTPPSGTFTQVSSGGSHTCGVMTDGTVACWGEDTFGQSTAPVGTFTQVSAGGYYTCGVRTDGTVACWGRNDSGQSSAPSGTYREVSAGYYHTCAVRTGGTVACWGLNGDGQSTPPSGTFTEVRGGDYHTCGVRTDGTVTCWGRDNYGQSTPPGGAFARRVVAVGGTHACGLRTNGTVVCWGDNAHGQSTPPSGTLTSVTAGWSHTCGVKTDGTVACWGWNTDGQSTPPPGTFTQVSGGGIHTCGVKSDGTVACWGWNGYGQSTPPAGTFTRVSGGNHHTCGLKTDGTVACWGSDDSGQSASPSGTFTEVSSGNEHTCGLRTDGTVACWGSNTSGQSTPPTGTFTEVSSGGFYACGLKTDGTVACWGMNGYGESTPPPGTFAQLSNGLADGCSLQTDGTMACWGRNANGQAPRLAVSPSSPPGASVNAPYTATLTLSGGAPAAEPFGATVVSDSLPPGLSLARASDTTYALSGIPTSIGSYTFTLHLTDSNAGLPMSNDQAFTLPVRRDSATTITAVAPEPSVVGQPVSLHVAVTSSFVDPTPTGMVTVSDGVSSCVTTLPAIGCTMTITTPGTRTLTATYSGDASFGESTSTGASHMVNPAATTTTISSDAPDPSTVGQSVNVAFAVTVNAPGAGTPTGNVTVTDGVDSCTATVAAGGCGVTLSTAGHRSLVATYAGNASFFGSTSAPQAHDVLCVSVSLVPDGRAAAVAVPGGGTKWLVLGLRAGEAYSLEAQHATGSVTPSLTLYPGPGGCLGGSPEAVRNTTALDPVLSNGVRYAFTATDPFYVLRLVGAPGAATYQVSVAETTSYSPAWSTNGSYDTYYSLQNTTTGPITARLALTRTDGTNAGETTVTIPAGATISTNTAAIGTTRNATGSARLRHDGPPGALLIEAAIANFSTAYIQPVRFRPMRESR